MEYYKNEIRDVLENQIAEGYETKEEILKRWADGNTEDDFGNMSGSRFCNRASAEEALEKAGFPWNSELNALLEEVGYNAGELLERGPEVVDVILCELVVRYAISEL